ncbi:DNA-binding response regulator [Kushneria pakistanensis]|uniref:DNA-binding response regulator n=1 Tax=Kushneria pakistanensis TaxID=1508770 RepID=A0ABQ3FGQ7_9GAMM|nr:response regulator transcription factor [Kushneria pakistanensis]GHC23086.1 DNA-binding response regulator [Kushneria pakistanensis]
MSADRPRILIVDDEFQIRRFLRISLASQGHEVIEAATGGEGLVRAIGDQPDLVLLDLGLPDIDGREVLQAICSQSDVPVIVVSVRASEREKVACLDAGASDYVTKPFGIQELLARVRAALRQQVATAGPSPSRQFHVGALAVDADTHRVTLGGEPIRLTPREFAVLTLLAEHAGRVITQTQLLREIWGPVHEHDTHYLRIVISRLRHKLDDDPEQPRLIQTEAGVGYRLVVPG